MPVQLTGDLPFEPSDEDEKPVAPDCVHEDDREHWEELEVLVRLHDKWVSQLGQAHRGLALQIGQSTIVNAAQQCTCLCTKGLTMQHTLCFKCYI